MNCDILLVDGNSMLFRAYYATLYSGANMHTSTGVSTNAVYGFVNMLNKAIQIIQPKYVMVAWDSGKPTFRHEQFSEYKGTRKQLDEELIIQFPIVREYLDAYGIFRYEEDGIEADDIIGTLAKRYKDSQVHILSSDNDLLQLIDDTTEVMLMKKGISEMQRMDVATLYEQKSIKPYQVIEMKGLMGDASDNIPGVKGVGEKTALKLISEYDTVENVYEHIDEIKGKLKEKLVSEKAMALLSKQLATIKTDCDIDVNLEDFSFDADIEALNAFFKKYEMHSFIKDVAYEQKESVTLHKVDHLPHINETQPVYIYIDYDTNVFYDAMVYGVIVVSDNNMYYLDKDTMLIDEQFQMVMKLHPKKITYDCKMLYHLCNRYGIDVNAFYFDLQIAAFLVDNTISSFDALLQAHHLSLQTKKEEVYGKANKPKMTLETDRMAFMADYATNLTSIHLKLEEEIQVKELTAVMFEIEMPLASILFEMEKTGVTTSLAVLQEINQKTLIKLKELEEKIFAHVDAPFNINSPKQLAEVLFDKLQLKSNKKRSTAIDVLEKLQHEHPVVAYLIEYRKYQKINSTYAEGLQKYILRDGKIHTIYHQSLAQTGRLSSSDPNLQNLSVKDEEAREIRKAFVASEGCILYAADYSQIELRVLAHLANEDKMIQAFKQGVDIHTQTAMLIFNVGAEAVDATKRRQAKTVNFGMVYGQTQFGLASELDIDLESARNFMDNYFASYPQIKGYMDKTIAFCKEHGYVTTMFNRRRIIKEINDKNFMIREFGKRAAMNAPIQGSAADLIKLAMIKVDKLMREHNMQSKLILQIHDELVFDVVLSEQEQMQALISEAMEHVYEMQVPLVVDGKFANNYYECK